MIRSIKEGVRKYGVQTAFLGAIVPALVGCGFEQGQIGSLSPVDCKKGPSTATTEIVLRQGNAVPIGVDTDWRMFDSRGFFRADGNGGFLVEMDSTNLHVASRKSDARDNGEVATATNSRAGVSMRVTQNRFVTFEQGGISFVVSGVDGGNGDTQLKIDQECSTPA